VACLLALPISPMKKLHANGKTSFFNFYVFILNLLSSNFIFILNKYKRDSLEDFGAQTREVVTYFLEPRGNLITCYQD